MANEKKSFIDKAVARTSAIVDYCWNGVWRDPRQTMGISVIKTINLSVRSFLDRDLQAKSMALTYSTVLAIVPAFALLLAICRGFGLQDMLMQTLPAYFPAQTKAIETALTFVDDYLKQASSGIFVGVGIVVLLWTLISLLSNIEDSFNKVWDIRRDRSLYQKITDYIAICLIVPVLMICSSGISIFMSTTLQDNLHLAFLTPLINAGFEFMPVVLAWMAFSLSFYLIPNTKVQFRYAVISGAICAVTFQVVQMLFVNGQIYVSKYNAIYGSFSFLPLLLVWLQLSWLILMFGCVLTFSMQNVFAFNYLGDVNSISREYMVKLTLAVAAVITQRFAEEKPALTLTGISRLYGMPIRVVGHIVERLRATGLTSFVSIGKGELAVAPAVDTSVMTAGEVMKRLDRLGNSNFIPDFDNLYPDIVAIADNWTTEKYQEIESLRLVDLPVPTPEDVARMNKSRQNSERDRHNDTE